MRKVVLVCSIAALTLAAPRVRATPATCTVTQLDVVATSIQFPRIGAVGLAIPVDIDAASGRFTMQRDAFTTAYPSPGLKFATGFGPFGWLEWDPGTIEGTIDSNGQVVLPNFGMHFWTDFGMTGVAGLAGDMNTTFTTGIQARSVAGRPWLFYGQALNDQGVLRLEGTDFINYQIAQQTGTGLTCTLSPAPSLTDLPKGPSLALAKGKVKTGPEATAADDELTLTAALLTGATAPVLDGQQDVLLRLKGAQGETLNLLVPGGSFRAKGKKLTVQDDDGSVITAISDHQPPGQDEPAAPPATQGGSLVIRKAKKRTTFTYKVKGLETAQLSGTVDVTLGVGTQSASRQVTFTSGKKGPKFK